MRRELGDVVSWEPREQRARFEMEGVITSGQWSPGAKMGETAHWNCMEEHDWQEVNLMSW